MINETIRLQAVERFKNLNIEADDEFQEILQMASDNCNTPIALLTLVGKDTQWLKVKKGTGVKEMPREVSFSNHTIQDNCVMVIADTIKDDRFAGNPIVVKEPKIRFYAGAPLITKDGYKIGSLCVVDLKPHDLSKQQELMLKMLSRQAVNLMELRISVEMLEKNKIAFELQQEVIRKAEISQRSFFESAPNFHVLLNKNAEVIDFNKVAYKFIKKIHNLKLTRGSMFIKYIVPEFVNKFFNRFELALGGENAFEEGFTNYGEHGVIYWEASFETARDADGDIIGVSYIIRDVSDRKIKEIKILAQNQSLLEIAHVQAHEFRAPLTTIMGMMSLIKSENYNAPREYFDLLANAVDGFDKKICEIMDGINNMVISNKVKKLN